MEATEQLGIHPVQPRAADLHRAAVRKFSDGVFLRSAVSGVRECGAPARVKAAGGSGEVGVEHQDGASDFVRSGETGGEVLNRALGRLRVVGSSGLGGWRWSLERENFARDYICEVVFYRYM